MISRYYLRCPGCAGVFVARIGAQPTDLTKFYLPCPLCQLPIRGRMSGQDLENHSVSIESEKVSESELPDQPLVVTVDPFVPSRYDADSHDGLGTFPTMTLMHMLGQAKFEAFLLDSGRATVAIQDTWPGSRMAFEYYLQGRWDMFDKTATSKLGLEAVGATAHQRSTVAYQSLAQVTFAVVGSTGDRGARAFDRFSRKHLAAIASEAYRGEVRKRDAAARELERDMFGVISHFIASYESWSIGRLVRFVEEPASTALDALVLYRDEFTLLRDMYQQGFELACRCLWILVGAQNAVKRSDPNAFGEHPAAVPVKSQAHTLVQFDKLANAYKIAYVAQVPGWESVASFLDSQRRNTIGHASARHDLASGRIVSDRDPLGITYLDFLGEVLGVFETLSSVMQMLRLVRVAASPDFEFNRASA